MNNKFSEYNSFLCYRKNHSDFSLGYSENVAWLISRWINSGVFSDIGGLTPALFEECYVEQGQRLTYDRTGIEKFMPGMKHVFVIITPDFFQELCETYYSYARNPDVIDKDAIEKTKQYIEQNKCPVAYTEINCALRQKDVLLHAVFVKTANPIVMSKHEENIVKNVFGERASELLFGINSLSFNYKWIEEALRLFAIINPSMRNWIDAGEEVEAHIENSITGIESVKKFQITLHTYLSNLNVTDNARGVRRITDDDLKDDLAKCINTIGTLSIPNQLGRFSAAKDEVVFDPLTDPKSCMYPVFPYALIRNFNRNSEEFGLDSNEYAYWNVELREGPDSEISTCAICFGTLMSYHRLTKDDTILLQHGKDYCTRVIKAGLNLLITIRDPERKLWPSTWRIENGVAKTVGTVNQTTLSLSTLMSCGFLSTDDTFGTTDLSKLEKRFGFIWESVDYLIQEHQDGFCSGWNYNFSPNSLPAIAPTVFVFDTFFKLLRCIEEFPEELRKKCNKQYDKLLDKLDKTIESFDGQFCKHGRDFGAFKNGNDYSITHTAYIIKSLYAYIARFGNGACGASGDIQSAKSIIKYATEYLLSRLERMRENDKLDFAEHERFEKFYVAPLRPFDAKSDGHTFENYEHCSELIVCETLVKILNDHTDERAFECLQWMVQKYIGESGQICYERDFLYINGKRGKDSFPIYYLYYYRMFLFDYLSLNEVKKGSEKLCAQSV